MLTSCSSRKKEISFSLHKSGQIHDEIWGKVSQFYEEQVLQSGQQF